MRGFCIKEAACAAGGTYIGPKEAENAIIKDVVIDNRKVTGGELFVAIKGERLDGHDFIKKAIEAGAICAISSKRLEGLPHILVDDTLLAFQRLAGWYKSGFDVRTVGITGSVGKTTTKEMVAAVLREEFVTLKSAGNLNNQTGVPQNLMRLEEEHRAAVIEMGTNHFGEIDSLAAMVVPDICLFTNIGDCHIEFLGSREGILKAKSEMLPHMAKSGIVLANGDDPLLATLKNKRDDVQLFGLGEGCCIRGKDVENKGLRGSSFKVDGQEYFVPAPGKHMVTNALAAIAVGRAFGMDYEGIKRGIENYKPVSGRMVIEEAGGITVLNDVYNANPGSVRGGIDVLLYAAGRKVAVLGDMLELGPEGPEYHRSIGRYAAAKGVDILLAVGELSKNTAEGAGSIGVHFPSQEQLILALGEIIKPGDTVLVKASRGMHLERTVEALKEKKWNCLAAQTAEP